MVYELFFDAVSNVGFPIVIALYVLIRLERVIKDNTEAISDLRLELRAR